MQLLPEKRILVDHKKLVHIAQEFCRFHHNREIESFVDQRRFDNKNRLRLVIIDVLQAEGIEFYVVVIWDNS